MKASFLPMTSFGFVCERIFGFQTNDRREQCLFLVVDGRSLQCLSVRGRKGGGYESKRGGIRGGNRTFLYVWSFMALHTTKEDELQRKLLQLVQVFMNEGQSKYRTRHTNTYWHFPEKLCCDHCVWLIFCVLFNCIRLKMSSANILTVVCLMMVMITTLLVIQSVDIVAGDFEMYCMNKCATKRNCKKYGAVFADTKCESSCKRKCYKVS